MNARLKEGVALAAIVVVLFGGFWMAIGPAKRCDLRQDWDAAVHHAMGRGDFIVPVNISVDCLQARQLSKYRSTLMERQNWADTPLPPVEWRDVPGPLTLQQLGAEYEQLYEQLAAEIHGDNQRGRAAHEGAEPPSAPSPSTPDENAP